MRLALQSSHASAISCISLDFAGAALASVEPIELGQSGVILVLELLRHCVSLLQQVITLHIKSTPIKLISCSAAQPSRRIVRVLEMHLQVVAAAAGVMARNGGHDISHS